MAKTIVKEFTGTFLFCHRFPWDQIYGKCCTLSFIEGLVYLVSFSERSRGSINTAAWKSPVTQIFLWKNFGPLGVKNLDKYTSNGSSTDCFQKEPAQAQKKKKRVIFPVLGSREIHEFSVLGLVLRFGPTEQSGWLPALPLQRCCARQQKWLKAQRERIDCF